MGSRVQERNLEIRSGVQGPAGTVSFHWNSSESFKIAMIKVSGPLIFGMSLKVTCHMVLIIMCNVCRTAAAMLTLLLPDCASMWLGWGDAPSQVVGEG